MKKAEVKFENITKKFNETVAVDNVSCTFEAGTLTTLLGPTSLHPNNPELGNAL